MQEKPSLLSLRGIRKRFNGSVALDGVDLELRSGEILALLGENGAGKSTLMKILGGIHQADEGDILIQGERMDIRQVSDADHFGIRLIHQELALSPNLSIAENIYLGREPARWGLVDRRRMFADATRLRDELGWAEMGDVRTPVSHLSVSRQQLVEIARALAVKVRILVLDEPTAALSETETENLFSRLRQLRAQGVGIIYISHRLEEISRLADRITVLREGRSMGTQPTSAVNTQQLIQWMVGRDMKDRYPRLPAKVNGTALTVRNLEAPAVNGVSFELHYGEVLGIAGLVGAGRSELAGVLAGLTPATGGVILVEGQEVQLRSPAAARAAGIVLVPEDRKRTGLVISQTAGFNLSLPWTHLWMRGIWPDRRQRDAIVSRAITRFAVKTPGPGARVSTLSGGNQQKVAVGKWMECPPRILILDEPTRGVDVGAREEMFALIGQLVSEHMAVLLISSDLPEVMNLSHRLMIYREGRVIREGRSTEFSPEQVMEILTK